MSLNLNVPTIQPDLSPRITVIGVGGAGGNAVNNMIQTELDGVEFLIANSDAQAIAGSMCNRCIQLGRNITQGLGAGSRPDIGRAAAEEALDEIVSELEGCNMVFVTAGMGGGTGTGAAPVIARAAREAGILTVGVVTKPFHFEGVHRMRLAEAGINELTQYVDTLIIIPNQNLFRVANEKTTFADAFKMADDVLNSGVRGVTDLMVNPGLINLDFADIRSVMSEMGKAMMGTGEAEGENRALGAAEAAISNPLLDDVSMKGARGVLINITGGLDLTLFEVDEAANRIRDEVDPEANIIFGSTFDPTFEGRMRVSVVSTGIDADAAASPRPVSLSLVGGSKSISVPDAPAAAASLKAAQVDGGLFGAGGGGGTAQALAVEAIEESEIQVGLAEAAEVEERLEQDRAAVEESTFELDVPDTPAVALPAAAPVAREPVAPRQPLRPESVAQQAKPVVPQAGVADGDGFFAPPPMKPEVAPQLSPEAAASQQPKAEPFAEAALTNAARPSPADAAGGARKSAQSLFARMTGGASRVLQAATSGADGTGQERGAVRREAVEPQLEASPQAAPRQPAPETPRQQPAPTPNPAQQTALSGLERKSEEEMLDIPAFLRRQAN